MKTIIFYFSGTGNSHAIAEKMAELLSNSEVFHIKSLKGMNLTQYDQIGFVYPSYAIHAPAIVTEYIEAIELQENQKVFLTVTYGGTYGYAIEDVRKILMSKNITNLMEFKLHMPGSYLLEYGAFPNWYQNYLLKGSEKKLKRICNNIRKEKKGKEIAPNMVAILFQKNGRQMMENFRNRGKLFYTDKTCIQCGKCAAICPADNISYKDEAVVWGDHCTQCMACIQNCDKIIHPLLKPNRKKYHHPQVNIIQDKVTHTWYSSYQK